MSLVGYPIVTTSAAIRLNIVVTLDILQPINPCPLAATRATDEATLHSLSVLDLQARYDTLIVFYISFYFGSYGQVTSRG